MTAWATRRAALVAYRNTLVTAAAPDPDRVLADLLHLHHVRMAGIGPDRERACAHLARAAALRQLARLHRSTP